MKKSLFGVVLVLCLLLCSCSSGGPFTVTFDANGCEDPAPLTLTEIDEPILESSRSSGQDAWIGTGSVVKVDDTYYLFYTGHTGASNAEFKEKIMVAKGSDPYHFEKVDGWYIDPPAELEIPALRPGTRRTL